ncbi:hypothetical protein D3C73_1058790 [compost metagenome]
MGKTADNFSCLQLDWGRALLGEGNDLGKIFRLAICALWNVLYTRIPRVARRKDAIQVAWLWRYNAVGSHENRSVKVLEFTSLLPPGIAVIADKMIVFLEGRIIVSRQHLAVRVYIYAGSFSLLQKLLKILQVMTTD